MMTAMAERFTISMVLQHPGSPRDREARAALTAQLPADAEGGEPDGNAVFDVTVEGVDLDGALHTIWNAVAASGTDDHLVFLEHTELPEHWRHRSGAAPSGA
jgi:hypothetical protein